MEFYGAARTQKQSSRERFVIEGCAHCCGALQPRFLFIYSSISASAGIAFTGSVPNTAALAHTPIENKAKIGSQQNLYFFAL
jgi:hypothetical protein